MCLAHQTKETQSSHSPAPPTPTDREADPAVHRGRVAQVVCGQALGGHRGQQRVCGRLAQLLHQHGGRTEGGELLLLVQYVTVIHNKMIIIKQICKFISLLWGKIRRLRNYTSREQMHSLEPVHTHHRHLLPSFFPLTKLPLLSLMLPLLAPPLLLSLPPPAAVSQPAAHEELELARGCRPWSCCSAAGGTLAAKPILLNILKQTKAIIVITFSNYTNVCFCKSMFAGWESRFFFNGKIKLSKKCILW